MISREFKINGMKCMHCKAAVENAIAALPGVESAVASVEDKNVKVCYDEARVDVAAMQAAVDAAGFEMEA